MNAAKTAMTRRGPSRPLRYLLAKNFINGSVLDYGCGKGADLQHLLQSNFKAQGFDPNFQLTIKNNHVTATPKKNEFSSDESFDTVLCTFVLNVLENEEDRWALIERVRNLGKRAIFTVRSHLDGIRGKKYKDGFLTSKGTFQKGFCYEDLKKMLPNATVIHKGPYIIAIIDR